MRRRVNGVSLWPVLLANSYKDYFFNRENPGDIRRNGRKSKVMQLTTSFILSEIKLIRLNQANTLDSVSTLILIEKIATTL